MRVESVGVDYCYLNFDGNGGDPIDGIDKYMMPIKVTDKLLLKIGFKYLSCGNELIKDFVSGINEIDIMVNNHNNMYSCSLWMMRKEMGCFDFKYLHELQNGIRLITKGNLEIWL